MGGLCLGVIPSFYFVPGKHGILGDVFSLTFIKNGSYELFT